MDTNKVTMILVVDDNATIRNLLRRWLEQDGYAVTDAADGLAAMELFSQYSPDLVICDIFMAEMDGFELIQALKRIDPLVRLLVISGGYGDDRREMLNVGRMLGATETLAKPFDMSTLLTTVKRILALDSPSG
jgi:CheY-like chemotaxis protein